MFLFTGAIILKYLVFNTNIFVFSGNGWSLCLNLPLPNGYVVTSSNPIVLHSPHGWFVGTYPLAAQL